MTGWCDYCRKCQAHIEVWPETCHVIDEDISLDDVTVVVCDSCGNRIGDNVIDDATLVRFFHKYNQHHGDNPITDKVTGKAW